MFREHTKTVTIGNKKICGGNPILIQSMTNTHTEDVEATVRQILELEAAGCEIIRCTVPTIEAAKAVSEIKKYIHIPLVAQFSFSLRQHFRFTAHKKYRCPFFACARHQLFPEIGPGNAGNLRLRVLFTY